MKQHPVTILVVDDDDGHLELVQRNLRRAGLANSIVVAHDGKAALDFVFGDGTRAVHAADTLLVLLDINMPGGIDGIEVLRRLKNDPRTHKVPVIMLTTTDDPREVARCYDLGCSVYITKPVDPQRFVDAIQRLGLFLSIVTLPSVEN
jgi:CheY-like chemotaxis protein